MQGGRGQKISANQPASTITTKYSRHLERKESKERKEDTRKGKKSKDRKEKGKHHNSRA